ncbi:hypothetical protein Tco_0109496 [Tanacetum coccineum]
MTDHAAGQQQVKVEKVYGMWLVLHADNVENKSSELSDLCHPCDSASRPRLKISNSSPAVDFVPCKSQAATVSCWSVVITSSTDTADGPDPSASRTDQQSLLLEVIKESTIVMGPKINVGSHPPHAFTNNDPQEGSSSQNWLGSSDKHLKPFGCQVTILNTSDYLGKFEGKADEGYLVGYASNSKAYRVYNLPNKRVEETLNLRFLEDKLQMIRNCHEWYTRSDSDSEVDEQVIVVPSFPSNSFAGPSSSTGPSVMERNADYAEELAKLQRQEYEAKDAAARYGYLFSQATAEILCQAEAEIRNQGVSAVKDPAGIDSAVREPAGIVSADGVSTGSLSADSDPAGSNPADCFPPAGSFEPADESNPAVSSSVSADFNPVYADESTLPPGQQLGSSENTTRFPVPSDVCMDQLSSGIFTSSSYDDDFRATLTNLAPAVEVNPVPTKRVNTIHPQSQILGDLASPVMTRSRAQKSKFGESAFIGYIQDQQRTNHTDQLHCLSACFLSQLEPTSKQKHLRILIGLMQCKKEMQ